MNGQITWADFAAAAGFVVMLVGAGAGVFWMLWRYLMTLAERIEEVRAKGAHELAEYKREVEREFARLVHMEKLETRLANSVDRLEDRINQLIEIFQTAAPRPRNRRPSE